MITNRFDNNTLKLNINKTIVLKYNNKYLNIKINNISLEKS